MGVLGSQKTPVLFRKLLLRGFVGTHSHERDERDETLETLVLVTGGSRRGLLTASASASVSVDYGVVWTLSKPEGAPEEYRSPRAREEY
ncbi:hypothetical protein NDU88_009927 [Pleurodeles waltl]|uniref:Uncharacterized protein n=1 Tax=Pleurodeles waltl TaxID=8319 RepID=A0AAV7QWG2_PLEWA|nr:hypothetical protein NDU88_009927 [Pleurodeles waltl]